MSCYIVIPAPVRHSKALSEGAKLLFGDIAGLAKKEGYCFASNGKLAEIAGTSTRQITRYLTQLETEGFIRREDIRDPDENRKIYLSTEMSRGVTETSNSLDKKVKTPLDKKVEHTNNTLTITDTNYPFGMVWDLYGKKVEKKRSIQLWSKLSDPTREKILKHVPLFVQATPDKQFRPALAVYLRGHRWEDDELPVAPSKKTAPWAKPEVTANRVRSYVVCGAPATHSYQSQSYCEDHDQYTKRAR